MVANQFDWDQKSFPPFRILAARCSEVHAVPKMSLKWLMGWNNLESIFCSLSEGMARLRAAPRWWRRFAAGVSVKASSEYLRPLITISDTSIRVLVLKRLLPRP